MTLLDDVLPRYDFRERHAVTVSARAEDVFRAVEEVSLAEMPIARLLFRLRGMRPRSGRVLELMERSGFQRVAEEPGREVVLAAVGQPWRARGGIRRDVDVLTFAESGYARMALNFRLDGETLSTETRVLLTDARSRRLFGRYWLVVRPFSGLIRRLWLRAIRSRARRRGVPARAARTGAPDTPPPRRRRR